MDIEWQEGAVCFAGGKQWNSTINNAAIMIIDDYQLNTIKQGDCIKASELDTEQKYNDVVEVFGLFGFERGRDYENTFKLVFIKHLKALNSKLIATDCTGNRKLTYTQIMAIGELKRLETERDKSAPKIAPDLTPDIDAKTAKDYLNECIEVQNQRGEQYDSKGTGERSFAAAASAFNAMTGQNLKVSDVCLLFTCVKAVRQYSDTTRVHEDSLLDLVSYASLWAEELNKEIK